MKIPKDYTPGEEQWQPFQMEFQTHNYPGKFIVFEGIDGSGKTTFINALSRYLEDRGQEYLVTKTPTYDIRNTNVWRGFFDESHEVDRSAIDGYGLSLLTFGDRLLHQRKVVEPTLRAGKWVLCDRYILSSAAHQSSLVHRLLIRLLIRPDLGVLVDVDPAEAIRRIQGRTYEKLHSRDARRFSYTRERLEMIGSANGFIKIGTTHTSLEDSFEELKKYVDEI